MEPLIVLLAGLAALGGGVLILWSFGPAYRIGRLIATTPRVSAADAIALARAGSGRYVRVDGRIASEEEFLDENDRPLVFRRARLQLARRSRWETLDEQRRAVPFSVREGLDEIAVAADELREGLVVVPRESTGAASEIPDRIPENLPPSSKVRYRLELVSSVEHATVLGVPRLDASGQPILGSGTRRPLVLATLEQDEAMRVLAGGGRGRAIAAASLLLGGLALVAGGGAWALVRALA